MRKIYNSPDEAVSTEPEEAVELLREMAKLGPVSLNTRRSGWSCDVFVGVDYAGEDAEPTVRGYGYEHGPHGAVGTAWAKLRERGIVE